MTAADTGEGWQERVPAIWPLGHGCVMTSYAVADGRPLFFFRAVRDDLVGKPGAAAGFDAWNACEGAPTLTIAFADVGAIDRLIANLTALSDEFKALPNPPASTLPDAAPDAGSPHSGASGVDLGGE